MDLGLFIGQFLTGLASASSLFLVAAGLSIIFGVTRIVNFAHGSFFMLGAYLAYTFVEILPYGILGFWGSVIAAAVLVGLIGVFIEMLLLRRIYHAPELFQLVATFGVVLIIQDVAQYIWGPEDLFGPRAPGLDSFVKIAGQRVPEYDLALIVIGPSVLLITWLLFHRTRWGVLVRAATQDREMTGALGINQDWLFTSVFFVGSFLAGLGGALQMPREGANLLMDLTVISDAFVVVVIGGMGSVVGAFLAAVIIGELNAFGILVFPKITIVLAFLVMAIVLVIRPWGLLGKPEKAHAGGSMVEAPMRLLDRMSVTWIVALLVVLALLPGLSNFGLVNEFTLVLLTDIFIFSLFAVALHFIMGPGGMVSFGHAAYFGLGAYGSAMTLKFLGAGMELSLLAAPVAAGLGALIFGWFFVRLSGVYLAMLTLAAAQIVWSIVFQWGEVTGGDDGMLGIWPSEWASSKAAFYYLAMVLCLGGIWVLRRFAYSPFGYVIRGARDSQLRTESIGINVKTHQWVAFVVSGAAAGLAGGVFVFSKGSVFPDTAAISQSVDGLVMVLLGGVQSMFGPIAGAVAYNFIEDEVTRLDYWRFIFGGIILAIVIIAPDGIAGGLGRLTGMFRKKQTEGGA